MGKTTKYDSLQNKDTANAAAAKVARRKAERAIDSLIDSYELAVEEADAAITSAQLRAGNGNYDPTAAVAARMRKATAEANLNAANAEKADMFGEIDETAAPASAKK